MSLHYLRALAMDKCPNASWPRGRNYPHGSTDEHPKDERAGRRPNGAGAACICQVGGGAAPSKEIVMFELWKLITDSAGERALRVNGRLYVKRLEAPRFIDILPDVPADGEYMLSVPDGRLFAFNPVVGDAAEPEPPDAEPADTESHGEEADE